MSGEVRIDDSRSPLFVVEFHGTLSDETFAAYLRDIDRINRSTRPRAFVYDATHSKMTSASQRRMQAEWMKATEQDTAAFTAGVAFVIPSPIVRGVLTAILWLQPMACPHTVVGTPEQALTWCQRQLAMRDDLPLDGGGAA